MIITQLQYLNKLLETQDPFLITTHDLNDDYFSQYKPEFKFIKDHLDKYNNIPDKATFLTQFPDFDFIEVSETPEYLISALQEDKNQRDLAEVFNKVKNLLTEGKTDEAMALYANSSNLASRSKQIEAVNILTDQSRYDAYLDRCDNFNKYYVKTGFKELDGIIGGWDRQEELATIAARTNAGKSWVLYKCAVSALEQGLTVGIYSGEMSDRKVGYRIDTLISNISNTGIIKGNRDLQNVYKNYLDDLPNKFKGAMYILTPNSIGGPAGVNTLRGFIEKYKLDILFIDQHSLLEDDRHAKNPVEKAANISKDLKNLQVLKQIPIISVSQQNRASTDNGVDTTHIAQSDRIAQDSTIVIFFEQNKDEGTMTMHLVKSRDSVNMKDLTYKIDLDKGRFIYIPGGDESMEDQKQLAESFGESFEENVF